MKLFYNRINFLTFIRHKKYLTILIIFLLALPAPAQVQLDDNARISLITASPWYGQVYAFFGHTAIRVQDDSTGLDEVFNYGYFDTSIPYFIYYYLRGETDYRMASLTYDRFVIEYREHGQQLVEQEMNLTPVEKQQLFDALIINARPENCEYRYNYFYDNCSTRPRDLMEKIIDGKIQYPPTTPNQSYRDLVHEFVKGDPWVEFGIDLLIGNRADTIINVRDKMFIPSYLMNSFEGASIHRNDTLTVPLVKKTEILSKADTNRNMIREQIIFTPLVVAFALFILTVFITLIQVFKMNRAKISRVYDTFLFAIAGVAGLIIFVMMFFSVHPATNPNWNFVWLNPFAFFASFFFWMKSANKAVYFYHFINFALLTLFLLFWWLIPQQLPLATIPFSMCLLLRSWANSYLLRKRQLKNKQFSTSRYLKAGWGEL